jgi:hypothetical protein
MKFRYYIFAAFVLIIFGSGMIHSQNFIPANNPYIQYFGRWDTSDSLHPKHSGSGNYIIVEFTGRKIGVRMDDNSDYYNVYIDSQFRSVFHGSKAGEADYILVDSLTNSNHTLLFSKRNFTFGRAFTFSGLILEDGAKLLAPQPKPIHKIEFIGDSFTSSEGNEAKLLEMPWEDKFPLTNIDKGFAVDVAKYFNAQYNITSRSGMGLYCDWQGKVEFAMPKYFDRTLMELNEPKWDFKKFQPEVVVICLGLNDYSGLKDKSGEVSEDKSLLFRNEYHKFIATIRSCYPSVKIVLVAAQAPWIHENVKEVVDIEKQAGTKDIYFTKFDRFEDSGYVANGHPTVETHKKIADEIIKVIEANHLF